MPTDAPDTARPELNWAGTHRYAAAGGVARPATLDEARAIVASGARIRPLGTRHSFHDIADGPGVLVDLTGLSPDLVVSPDRRRAGVAGGTRYGTLATLLEQRGLALANMGSLPHISVAGAIATGTHGSGTTLAALGAAVVELEILGADGELRTVRRGDADFDGSVVALGALGLTTRVTLEVEPSYRMRQDAYADLPWESALADLPAVFAAGYSVSLFTEFDGRIRELWVKTRIPAGADDAAVPDERWGAVRMPPRPATERGTPVDGTVGAWCDRLPHFRIGGTPSVGAEIQSEHFVALADGAAALEAVAALGERIRPHLHTSELRSMAGDGQWLSPAQGRETLGIAFTWRPHPEAVAELLPDVEAALAPFEQRPHWGKMSSLGGDELRRLYPRLDRFRELVERRDPGGVFRGPFLDRLLG